MSIKNVRDCDKQSAGVPGPLATREMNEAMGISCDSHPVRSRVCLRRRLYVWHASVCLALGMMCSAPRASAFAELAEYQTAISVVGQAALKYVKEILLDSFSTYLKQEVRDGLNHIASNKGGCQEIAFAKARPLLTRTFANFHGEYWTEDDRTRYVWLKEANGKFKEGPLGSFESTNYSGNQYTTNQKLDDSIILAGDRGSVPREFLDGVEISDESFFRDRLFSVYGYTVGDHESDQTSDILYGSSYIDAPSYLYTFEGSRYRWDASYKFTVDVGLSCPNPVSPLTFRNIKTLPVKVIFKLADITPEAIVSPNGAKELILKLKSRSVFHSKVKNTSLSSAKEYSITVLEHNTQLLNARVIGAALAYFEEVRNPLKIWESPSLVFREGVLMWNKSKIIT
ncbi:MAG: hypothetical protein LR011_03765 [Verrucomicrobia bacterium]|nr:hypothetical protein [Verrucomicrobiota bacterium]